uniref:Secreted protein n=1 Tax=Ixodes scapularis TaxID=6945 RepID=A0A4D5REM1_IXOSC
MTKPNFFLKMFFPIFLILYPLCLSSVVARPEKADQEFVKLQHSLRCKKASTETATYLYSGAMTLGFFFFVFQTSKSAGYLPEHCWPCRLVYWPVPPCRHWLL